MKVYFNCNLDWYASVGWPVLENIIPPIGADVFVITQSMSFCEANNIPPKLKVVSVYIYDDKIICDLWYDSAKLKLESEKRIKHLMKQ